MSQPAVAYVLKKMGDLLVDEAIFLYNVPDKFDQVKRELTRMEAFLKDADSKQKRDERVKNWVNEIRDVARHVEDLVDTFFLKARQRRRLKSYLFCLNDRHVLGMEIDRILGQIREISVSRATYGIENLGGDADGGEVDESLQNIRRIYPYANDEADNVGLEDEKRKILKKLFDKSVKRRRVISIVGMGGLGKTTLAKKVFKNTEIKSRFDCSVWINVSQKYNTIDLLRDLLKGVMDPKTKEELASMDRGNLEVKLHNDLSGKCYLIVMDDIWNAETYFSRKYSTPNLRTLLGYNLESCFMGLLPLNRLKLLRVVDIEGAQVKRLPEEIGDMVHLRYLGLRNTGLEIIPSSIGNLHYLQVLDVKDTWITRILENASHIAVGGSSELRTLDMPSAGRWIDNGLSSLTKLESLGIYGISESHVAGLSKYLAKMPRLNYLELWGDLIPANALTLSSDRLYVLRLLGQIERPPIPYESQQLPRNLNKLELSDCKLQQDPLALTENLQWLRSLTLSVQCFQGKEMVCSASGFPQPGETGAMPRLVKLTNDRCEKLVMLPEGLRCTTSLQEFTVWQMPDEFIARVQKEVGVDWHKIKHSSSITINRVMNMSKLTCLNYQKA